MGRENILAHSYLWREITRIEHSSQKMAQQIWNIELGWKTQLLFLRDLFTKSKRTALKTYK